MSRSKRKTPIFSHTTGSGQRQFRDQENRAKRRRINLRIIAEDYDNMPHEKEYGNEWASPRDGKSYWGEATKRDMRK